MNASDGTDPARIEGRLVNGLIPSDRGDGQQLDLRVAVREQDRHGVVVTRVAIKNDFSHGSGLE
jgi:hypothetical protein